MKETFLETVRRWVHHPRAERASYAISAVLLVVSLSLPPVSAGTRIWHLDYPVVSASGGAISTADGAQLLVPEGALSKQLRLKISSVLSLDFLNGTGDRAEDAAAAALKSKAVTLQSDIYRFLAYGPAPKQSIFSLPLPANVDSSSADAYAWDGKEWEWTPSQVIPEDRSVEVHLTSMPSMVAVVRAKRASPSVATAIEYEEDLPVKAQGLLTELNLEGFSANADGSISDALGANRVVPQGFALMAVITNLQNGLPQAHVLNTILLDSKVRAEHIAALTALPVEKMFTGVLLDYRDLAPELKEEFSSFVAELAASLQKQGKVLAVQVETPSQISEDTWGTGAYDWQALGESVDTLVVPAIDTPTAFAAGGQMESLLRWAVGRVNRTKLQLALSVYGYQIVNGEISRIPYDLALWEVGQLAVEGNKQMVSAGEEVRLVLSNLEGSGGLCLDENVNTCWFAHESEDGQQHQVWLENAASLASKLQLVLDYNLHGVTLNNFLDPQNDDRVWDLLQYLKDLTIPPLENDYTVVWTIKGPAGDQTVSCSLLSTGELAVGTESAPASAFVWQAPDGPGEYSIAALISDDGGQTTLTQSGSVELEIPTPTPTSTPTPTPTPTATPTPKPTPKPAAAAPAASRGPGFAYGIQGDALTDGDHGRLFGLIQQLGFGWYKQQVEWFRYNPGPGQYDWAPLDRIVDSASAAGIKLLFSVVKAPAWARPAGDTDQGPPADPNTYGEFIKAMAARYKGRVQAYEIWNEQNLYYEWGGLNRPNAREYMALLKVAYGAVKSVDSGATVVSGALTPTGAPLPWAIDDFAYLEQMYQLGLKNYCDAVGVHPSGYNVPPDTTWQQACDVITKDGAGYRGPCNSPHHSWSFRSTMEGYRNIMVTYGDSGKRLWPTEFGWASVDGLGVPPATNYEFAADNTEAEQAQYTVRAYQMAKNWGWVGPMFLWNLNFGPICGAGDEKSAWAIVRPDWSMRQTFAGLANMPK